MIVLGVFVAAMVKLQQFKVRQGKTVALNRWGGKWNHHSMTYSLINKCAKNYYNRTFIVQVIAKNVVTCFFWDTVYLQSLNQHIVYMQNEMSNSDLHKFHKWVWPWPWTFKSRLKTELFTTACPTYDRSAPAQNFWFTMTMWLWCYTKLFLHHITSHMIWWHLDLDI